MANVAQPSQPTDVVLYEAPNLYSRDEVTVLSGEVLVTGEVVGLVTASQKWIARIDAAIDGSEVAAGVCLFPVDASAADVQAVILRRHSTVKRAGLTWDVGYVVATSEAELESFGIIVRDSA